MITITTIGQSVTAPITLAVVLVASGRRSANGWCLLAAFLAGALGAFSLNTSILRNLPSMLPEDQIAATTTRQAWLCGFVEAAIPEEFAKGVLILAFLVAGRQSLARHGALIGGLVGLGFALRENLAYAQTVAEWRVMGAAAHGAWGVIMGSLLQRAVTSATSRFRKLVWAFVPTILFHGIADTSIFMVEAYESEAGLNSLDVQPEDVLSPVLFSAMLSTVVVDVFALVWAVRIIRAIPRLDFPNIQNRAGDPYPSASGTAGPT